MIMMKMVGGRPYTPNYAYPSFVGCPTLLFTLYGQALIVSPHLRALLRGSEAIMALTSLGGNEHITHNT